MTSLSLLPSLLSLLIILLLLYRFKEEYGTNALNTINDANTFLLNMQITSIYQLYHKCYYDTDHLANNAYTRTPTIPEEHGDIMIRLEKYINENINQKNNKNNTSTINNDDDDNDTLSPIKRQRSDINILSPFSQSKEESAKISHDYYELWNLYELAEIKGSLL